MKRTTVAVLETMPPDPSRVLYATSLSPRTAKRMPTASSACSQHCFSVMVCVG